MIDRTRFGAALALGLLCAPAYAQHKLIPNESHKSLTFELHSVGDEVTLYHGEPQYLFALELRPSRSIQPHIEFSNTGQIATLRVLDLSLFERRATPEDLADEYDDLDDEPDDRPPLSQKWNMKLSPAGPSTFFLRCDGGKGDFDFTDMLIQELHLTADSTEVKMRFDRPNSVRLRRFMATNRSGTLKLTDFLNARPGIVTLRLDGSKCELNLTGKPFEGESEIYIEGVPKELRITLANVGLWIEGPAITVARFDSKHLERRGLALVSPDYESRTCKLRLHFPKAIRNLKVRWEN